MQGGVPGDGAVADAGVAEIESTVRLGVMVVSGEDCDDAACCASWASSLLIVSRVM